ncbi:UNKNOWN [Stylonychia lemnae]|uniref:Uncharacterized protein n=1 Tax=Stylonychia lemnae TaxID=5949 RepID=A0A078AKF0_STYLE|nr:UNKNOWN [Stylonychia lemnae]|eukprot:CDW82366.1 UNKNOWN [Stylonychia lemnae]
MTTTGSQFMHSSKNSEVPQISEQSSLFIDQTNIQRGMVKEFKMADYYKQGPPQIQPEMINIATQGQVFGASNTSASFQGKSFKELMMQTLNRKREGAFNNGKQLLSPINKSTNQVLNLPEINSLEIFDQILQKEQEKSGVRVFKQGESLKTGLIDLDQIYTMVQSKEAKDYQVIGNQDSTRLIPLPKQLTKKQKWNKVLQFASKNPQFLLDAIPSTDFSIITEVLQSTKTQDQPLSFINEQITSSFTTLNQSSHSRLKQRLQSDLNLSRQYAADDYQNVSPKIVEDEQYPFMKSEANTSVHSHYQKIQKDYQDALSTQQRQKYLKGQQDMIKSSDRPFSFCQPRIQHANININKGNKSSRAASQIGQQSVRSRQIQVKASTSFSNDKQRPKSKSQTRYQDDKSEKSVNENQLQLSDNQSNIGSSRKLLKLTTLGSEQKPQLATPSIKNLNQDLIDQESTSTKSKEKSRKKVDSELQAKFIDWSQSSLRQFMTNMTQHEHFQKIEFNAVNLYKRHENFKRTLQRIAIKKVGLKN